jgi:hypothetical protein
MLTCLCCVLFLFALSSFLVISSCFQITALLIHGCGPGSSVGIATGYGLDGPGIESGSGFGGLGVCMLASGTQDRGFAPGPKPSDFPYWKNPQHAVRYDTNGR